MTTGSVESGAGDLLAQVSPTSEGWTAWLARQDGIGATMAAHPWWDTPLGPLESWAPSLRGAVMLALNSRFPMTIWWGEELVVLPNDAARAVLGDARFDAALGRPVADVWPDTLPRIRSEMAELFRTGTTAFAANSLTPFDRTVPGEECYLTYSYTPIVDEDGRIAGVLCIFFETTAEVLAARRFGSLAELGSATESRESERELASAAVEVLARNPADHPAAALLRVAADTGEVALLAVSGPQLDADAAAALARSCSATRTSQHLPAEASPIAGLHGYPLDTPDGAAASHVLVLTHHEQRPWDEALSDYFALVAGTLAGALLSQDELTSERRRAAQLESLDEAKSAFFAGVSHELRTPLALIGAPIDKVLERDAGLSPETRAALTLAQGNVARLQTMVESMLDFTRLEAGRLLPALAPVDVSALTAGLAASFAPAFERAGLAFQTEVAALSRPPIVDRDFFERILLNLLSNAAKYTPSGTVTLSLGEDASHYWIRVSDTGVGIAAADADRVFDRFERLAPAPGVSAVPGAGIGLAMVRELARLLDGDVELTSQPGRGSTFTVRLPFRPSRAVGVRGQSVTPRPVESFLAEIAAAGPTTDAGQPPTAGARLLLVEDDPQLARFLVTSLSEDFRVNAVADGAAALDAIRADPPDLVLTDLSVPTVDGLELVRRLRADRDLRHLPVVLLSGHAGEDATSTGLLQGADDYITKPFSMLDLRSRLAANLARARQRTADLAWRRAVLTSMHDPVVIFDSDGAVLEVNASFTRLFGYEVDDLGLRPPYPWWPTEAEDAAQLAGIRARHRDALAGQGGVHEALYFDRDRRPVWVSSADAVIRHGEGGRSTIIRSFRDITRQKLAETRRATAARVSDDFGTAGDLETLIGVACHGLEVLFEGRCTIELDAGATHLFGAGGRLERDQLEPEVREGLAGRPSADSVRRRPGILLVHEAGATRCRAWIQFPRPRPIGPDEMIVADLLAKGFSLAVDRLLAERRAADKQVNLERAVESHRLIGQAVGILVERHRQSPDAAFEQLKRASQHRNVRLREIALRVIETGIEPSEA